MALQMCRVILYVLQIIAFLILFFSVLTEILYFYAPLCFFFETLFLGIVYKRTTALEL